MPSELKVNKLSPYTGSTLTIGDSGDTIAITNGASLTGFTSTGIDDNATNTAVTIDSSQNVGIGTTSPSTALDVDGTVTATQFVGGGLNAYRNLIINGDMSLAQRSTSETGITGNGYFTVDRFEYIRGTATTPTWTLEQSTDVPSGQGFGYSFKGTVTTAHTIASGSIGYFQQKIEARNLQQLNYGTSSAKTLSASFWVKSNVTGTYILELFQNDASKYLPASVTINSANTWEKKSVSFIGDTAGTIDNDSGTGLSLRFIMFAGTDFTSGTLATTWQSTSNQTDRYVGQVDVASTNSNYWQITGVQLEVGTSASDFEFLPYDVNLQRCQRYYFQYAGNIGYRFSTGYVLSATQSWHVVYHPTTMRSSPSLSYANFHVRDPANAGIPSAISIAQNGPNEIYLVTTITGGTAGNGCQFRAYANDAYMKFSAEL